MPLKFELSLQHMEINQTQKVLQNKEEKSEKKCLS